MKNLIICSWKGAVRLGKLVLQMFFPVVGNQVFDPLFANTEAIKKEFLHFFTHTEEVGLSTLPWLQTASGLSLGYPRWMKRWLTGLI